jgi:hypothetical protein
MPMICPELGVCGGQDRTLHFLHDDAIEMEKTMPAQRRKGDPEKVQIALRLRRETTMTLAWTAQRLL